MKLIATISFLGIFLSCSNQVKYLQLNSLFSDNMVLQRNTLVSIWGKGPPNKKVKVNSEWGENLILKCNSNGVWNGQLKTPEAGGPFSIIIISGTDKIKVNNVLIGEVWLVSGQSNMAMTLKGYPNEPILNSESEILNANYPNIRMFTVRKSISIKPLDDLDGEWIQTSSKSVKDFSATAYFFAKEIHKELNIPVGIINSSWGGSPAESWTSQKKLQELGLFSETLNDIEASSPGEIIELWFKQFKSKDIPKQKNPKDLLKNEYDQLDFSDNDFNDFELNDLNWGTVKLPGRFDNLISTQFDGAVWFRKEVEIDDITSDYTLNIGYIDDMDKTYINGHYVGGLSGYGVWNQKREFLIQKSLLKKGKNIIAIRAIDTGGPGFFQGPMNLSNSQDEVISIEGNWKYKPIAEIYEKKFYIYNKETSISKRPNYIKLNPFLPKVLFNSMINPLIPFSIKGALWYQGESNVGRHEEYNTLFPGLIEDWRSRWEMEFPFYYVQIAPFRYTEDPSKNVSQKLRESQRNSLKTSKTGMVVTLDIGNNTNIHPANKQDVGKRLARLALTNDYNSGLNPLGPILKSVERLNNSVKLNYDHVADGLLHLKGKVNQFKIAGSDNQFFEGIVLINKDNILISSDFIKNPKYVSYAWSDTPEATLFNSDGFPASSFMIEVD
ncbi:MAG: sialate O-acetylesterase [Candidatus Neomarinimicrobiota bacterium]